MKRVFVAVLLVACRTEQPAGSERHAAVAPADAIADAGVPRTAPIGAHAGTTTQMQMEHVDFRVDHSVVLKVRRLRGRVEATEGHDHPVFDVRSSFKFVLVEAEIAMSGQTMAD